MSFEKFNLIPLLLLLSGLVAQPLLVNADCAGDDGFYPNPIDCAKFFRCVTGNRYDFDCAPGTHFNPLISVCDWPYNAGCQSGGGSGGQEQVEIVNSLEPQQVISQPSLEPSIGQQQFDGGENDRYREEYGHQPFAYQNTVRKYPQYSKLDGAANEYNTYPPRPYQPPSQGYMAVGEYRQQPYVEHPLIKTSQASQPVIAQVPEESGDLEEEKKTLSSYVVYEKTTKTPPTKSGKILGKKVRPSPVTRSGRKFDRIVAQDTQINPVVAKPDEIQKKKKKVDKDPVKSLPKCDAQASAKGLCTLDNFDWLSIADTEISSTPTKQYKLQASPVVNEAANDSMKDEILRQVARQCEYYCNTLLQSRATNHSISCVGYSYTANSCRLFSQLELEIDWLPRIIEQSEQEPSKRTAMKSLRPASGHVSRIQLPRKELVNQKWLLTETQVPTDYFDFLKGNNRQYKEVKGKKNGRPMALGDCLKACQKKGEKKCRQFVYTSFEGNCYLRREKNDNNNNDIEDDEEERELEDKKKKQRNKSDRQIFVADVVTGENVEPRSESQAKAKKNQADQGRDQDDEEPNMEWHFHEDTDPNMLSIMQELLTLPPSLEISPIESIENVTDPHECRQNCLATWAGNEEEKAKCHFIAVQEDISQLDNKTYTCHLYAEEVIEMAIKLLQLREEANKDSHIVRNSTVTAVVSSSEEEGDQQAGGKRSKRRTEGEETLKAFVFNDRPTIRYYSLDDHETIIDAIAGHKPLMEWNGISKEEKCFQECLESLTTGELACRFLVIKKFVATFNCTFYDIDISKMNTLPSSSDNRRQGKKSSVQRYEVHSYPLVVPKRYFEARQYFNLVARQTPNDNKTLVPFHQIDLVDDINKCLHFCLKILIENNQTYDNHQCYQVAVAKVTAGQLVRYNCTLADVIKLGEKKQALNESIESILETVEGQVVFDLVRLTNQSFAVDQYDSLFNWRPANNAAQLKLTHYRPLSTLDHQINYRQCLEACVDMWNRPLVGDPRRDRCRMVVVSQSLNRKRVADQEMLYHCAYYDLELVNLEEWPKEGMQIFMMNKTYLKFDRPLPASINEPMLANLENRTSAFYHISHASSPLECVQICHQRGYPGAMDEPGNVWTDHNCQVVVAVPVQRFDSIYETNITEYSCNFYDIQLEVKFAHKPVNRTRDQERRAYQLQLQPSQFDPKAMPAGEYFSELDGQSDLVSLAMSLYSPVRHVTILVNQTALNKTNAKDETGEEMPKDEDFFNKVQNDIVSEHTPPSAIIAQCLIECIRYNIEIGENVTLLESLKEKFDKSSPSDCKFVTIASGVVKDGRPSSFECQFYDFNLTRFPRNDLDDANPLEAYQLNTTDLTALITTDYKSRFYAINETNSPSGTVIQLIRSQRPFHYVTGVNATKNCLKACFYTWPASLVMRDERRCRFVTVRRTIETITNGQRISYDCALYEGGVSSRLQSLQVLVRSPKEVDEIGEDEEEDESVGRTEMTARSTEYKHLKKWPLPLPAISDQVSQVFEPGTIEDCQADCDNATKTCGAILALYQRSRLLECYLVGSGEYLVDYNQTLEDGQHIKVAVKVSDLQQPMGGDEKQELKQESDSPYLAIIDAARRYEKNAPFADSYVP